MSSGKDGVVFVVMKAETAASKVCLLQRPRSHERRSHYSARGRQGRQGGSQGTDRQRQGADRRGRATGSQLVTLRRDVVL